jgi:hypothetical protein
MQKILRCVMVIALVAGSAAVAAAGELKLTIANGRATLIARDVPLRQILDEWARVGSTTIVNGDKLTGPPITLQLVDRPEREVLDLILRSASGYIAAPRQVSLAGASQFDRVMILPVSRGPVGVANAAPTPFGRPAPNAQPQPMPMQMPVTDDDDPVEPPQIAPPGMGPQNVPGPTPFPMQPGQQPGQQPAPITAPRPGILPAPPPGQPNPYAAPGTPGGPVPPPFVRPGGPGDDPDGGPGQDPDGGPGGDRDDNPGNERERDPGAV